MIFEAYGDIEIDEYAQSLYFLDSLIRVYYILGGITMDALKEELLELEKERKKKINKRFRPIDEYFDMLEKDHMAFMRDGSASTPDILEHSLEIERACCMRKIVVYKARLEALYSEMKEVDLRIMEDNFYCEKGEEIMHHLSEAINGFYELIDHYEEELELLGFGVLTCEIEANGGKG
jgi:plasmid maintenance system killer protein